MLINNIPFDPLEVELDTLDDEAKQAMSFLMRTKFYALGVHRNVPRSEPLNNFVVGDRYVFHEWTFVYGVSAIFSKVDNPNVGIRTSRVKSIVTDKKTQVIITTENSIYDFGVNKP